jgi:outer membrane protein assembly factor BamB
MWGTEVPVQTNLLIVGIAGCVVALDRATGEEIWRTRLKGDFANVALIDDALYAAASGELYCLDPATGRVRWNNPLKGLGRGLVTIATADTRQSVVLSQKKRSDDAAAAAVAATT